MPGSGKSGTLLIQDSISSICMITRLKLLKFLKKGSKTWKNVEIYHKFTLIFVNREYI